MLLKILVLAGLATYFYLAEEIGLSLLTLGAIVPGVGLVVAGILVIALLIKTWYGSAAILIGLIAFNLIGNSLLEKRDTSSSKDQNDEERRES